ncbi:hypothetical protein D3C84_1158290 [compost metagenome]
MNQIRDLAKQFKQAVESGDADQPSLIAQQIEEVWNVVQQKTESDHSDLYTQIAQDMSAFQTLFEADKLDQGAAVQQAYQLYRQFSDLSHSLDNEG